MFSIGDPLTNDYLPSILDRMISSISQSEHVPLHIPNNQSRLNSTLPPVVFGKEKHTMFELAFIDYGECAIAADNSTIKLMQGELLLIPPHYTHYIAVDEEQCCHVLWVGIELGYIGLHTTRYNGRTRRMVNCITVPADSSVKTLISRLHQEALQNAPYAAAMVKGYLLTLGGYLGRPIRYLEQAGMQLAPHLKDRTICSAIAYMDENHNKPGLSVAEVAHHVNMSTSYFSSRFKVATGYSPYRYLLLSRMDKASRLLCTTSWPVDAICSTVGFTYQHHFSSTFRRIFGVTPIDFRRQFQTDAISALPLIKTKNR